METRLRMEYFERIKQAKERDDIQPEHYDMLVDLPVDTEDELTFAYNEFIYYGYLEKARKGAEFIESITNADPRWFAAHRKLKEIHEIIEKVRMEQKEVEQRLMKPKGA